MERNKEAPKQLQYVFVFYLRIQIRGKINFVAGNESQLMQMILSQRFDDTEYLEISVSCI